MSARTTVSATPWWPFSLWPVALCALAATVIGPSRLGRLSATPLVRALGFTHRTPCAATLHTVLRRLDREALETKLGAWAEGLLEEAPRLQTGEDAIAIAGKTLRGS